jgi:hypothetical protein
MASADLFPNEHHWSGEEQNNKGEADNDQYLP